MIETKKYFKTTLNRSHKNYVFPYTTKETKLIMDEFKPWLDTHCPTVLSKPLSGQAFVFCLKNWHESTEFMTFGKTARRICPRNGVKGKGRWRLPAQGPGPTGLDWHGGRWDNCKIGCRKE